MSENKLISILKQFDSKELSRLSLFIQAEYFGVNKQMQAFLQHLIQQSPTWCEDELNDEKIFAIAYPEQKFSKQKLYYLRSDACKVVDSFVVHEKVEVEQVPYIFDKWQFYSKKNLPQIQDDILAEISIVNQKAKQFSRYYYYYQSVLQEKKLVKISERQNYTQPLVFDEWHNNIEISYYLNILEIYTLSLIQNHIYKQKNDLSQYHKIRSDIESKSYVNQILPIKLYLSMIDMFENIENESYWFTFKSSIKELSEPLNVYDLYNFYLRASAYCAIQSRYNKEGFKREAFDILHVLIDENLIYLDRPVIDTMTFMNYLEGCLSFDYVDLAKSFLLKQEKKLKADDREEVYNLGTAIMAFHEKEYEKTLKILNKINPSILFLEHRVKVLFIKVYVELREWEQVTNYLNAFRVRVARNQQHTDKHIEARRNFASFVNILEKMIEKNQKPEKIQQHLTELKQTKTVYAKDWLVQKFESLITS